MQLAHNVIEELWFAEDDGGMASEEASKSLAAQLGEVGRIGTFPVVAQTILSLLANPDFKMKDVTSALEEDPSLAGGVLRMANSALFAGYGPVATIQQSLVRLGGRTVRNVVAAVATMDLFKDVGGAGKVIRDHCAATGAILQYLARDLHVAATPEIFLCGLMHDLGQLLLIESGEMSYPLEYWEENVSAEENHILERNKMGYDHAVLGAHVLAHWKLPEPIPKVVAWHHQPARAYEDKTLGPLVAMLRIADKIDRILKIDPQNFEEHVTELAAGPDCHYAHVEADALISRASLCFQVREESLALFGG